MWAPCVERGRSCGARLPAQPAANRRTRRGRCRCLARSCAAPAPASRPEQRARCRAARTARTARVPGATRSASARTASMPGPTTTAMRSAPSSAAPASAWASIERPPTGCSTLGSVERMRTPLPAARTTTRSGLSTMWGCFVLRLKLFASYLKPARLNRGRACVHGPPASPLGFTSCFLRPGRGSPVPHPYGASSTRPQDRPNPRERHVDRLPPI